MQKSVEPRISFDDHAFTITAPGGDARSCAWNEVTEIEARKDDLLIVDSIRLDIRTRRNEAATVNEEMEGWGAFLEEVCRRFQIPLDRWWGKVAFPPFAENLLLLWSSGKPRV